MDILGRHFIKIAVQLNVEFAQFSLLGYCGDLRGADMRERFNSLASLMIYLGDNNALISVWDEFGANFYHFGKSSTSDILSL